MRLKITNAPTINSLSFFMMEIKEIQNMTYRFEALKQRIEVILNHYPTS